MRVIVLGIVEGAEIEWRGGRGFVGCGTGEAASKGGGCDGRARRRDSRTRPGEFGEQGIEMRLDGTMEGEIFC